MTVNQNSRLWREIYVFRQNCLVISKADYGYFEVKRSILKTTTEKRSLHIPTGRYRFHKNLEIKKFY